MGSIHRSAIVRALLVALSLAAAGCAPGAPPPGPIDLVRKVFDPSYDYTESPDTWRDADARPRRSHERWSSGCPEDDMTCSHEGVTICCSPADRCCAGRSGPYCCSDRPDYGDDRGSWYENE